MLTPDYLDTLPDAAAELWQQVEDDILRDIARRIGTLDELEPLTPTAQWQAWRYEQVQACHQDVLTILAKYSGRRCWTRRSRRWPATTRSTGRQGWPPRPLNAAKPSTTC